MQVNIEKYQENKKILGDTNAKLKVDKARSEKKFKKEFETGKAKSKWTQAEHDIYTNLSSFLPPNNNPKPVHVSPIFSNPSKSILPLTLEAN